MNPSSAGAAVHPVPTSGPPAATVPARAAVGQRAHGLDWARNAVVYTLILFHSARVFDSFEPFYAKSATTLTIADDIIRVLAPWSMSLLTAVAGAATWFALAKRSPGQYVRERLARLGVPLVFGVAVLVPPQSYIAARNQGYTGGYLGYWFGPFFTDWGDLTGYFGGFTPAHLWFLLSLLIIALALTPLLVRARRGRAPRLLDFFRRPAALGVAAVILTLCELFPAIGGKNLAVSAGYFLFGFAALPNGLFMAWAGRWRWALLAAGVGLMLGAQQVHAAWGGPSGVNVRAGALAVAGHLSTLAIIAGLVAVLSAPRLAIRALPALNRACLPFYVVHQTVIVALAQWILSWGLPAGVALPTLIVVSGAASAALVVAILRLRPLHPLFGVKPPAASAGNSVPSFRVTAGR